jgi:hypothetical protein
LFCCIGFVISLFRSICVWLEQKFMLIFFELNFVGSKIPFNFLLAYVLALKCWNSCFQTIGGAFALLVLTNSNVMELSVAARIIPGDKAILKIFII